MAGQERGQLNRQQIEAHLKSAVGTLTPDVLDRIDLTARREAAPPDRALLRRLNRIRAAVAMAACLCMVLGIGGVFSYRNSRVESVIGIDVNPSIELSVNRKDRVLEARALNEDAAVIMDGMELKGVDLNVAVNAVIGSMVKHGYLDDLDNAILVTVSNDSISRAAALRSEVVEDIQTSLEENQVRAVVYDQQAVEVDEVKALAEKYGISYGKAYFLDELIAQNPTLTIDDMERLAPLSMEEIARQIAAEEYALGRRTDRTEEPLLASPSTAERTTAAPDTPAASTAGETETVKESSSEETTPDTTAAPESSEEAVTEGKVEVDYADYQDGIVTVNFAMEVKWKNPTVSVRDKEGNTYAAMMGATGSDFCEILVDGLEGGRTYTFVLGGISRKIGKATTAKGTFETPVIGDGGRLEGTKEPTAPTEASTEVPTLPTAPQTEPTQPIQTEPGTEPSETAPAETPPQETPTPDAGGETDSTAALPSDPEAPSSQEASSGETAKQEGTVDPEEPSSQ